MRQAAFAAILLCLAATAVHAHTVIPGIGGFSGGLLHPLLVPAHALTLIALGLMSGTFKRGERIRLSIAFVAASALALIAIAMAYSAMQAETLVLCLGAAIGLLLATGFLPPFPVAAMLSATVAVTIVFDSVPPVLTVGETALSLAGTTLAATMLVAATAWLVPRLPGHMRQLAIRIAGSWIAASAIIALALTLSA